MGIEFTPTKEPINFLSPDIIEGLELVKKDIENVLESAKVDDGMKEKLAIGCIEDLAIEHNISFNLRFNFKQRKWSVTVLSNTVSNPDFILAVREALEIVLKVKNSQQ